MPENSDIGDAPRTRSVYVPDRELTIGQAPPIAANEGLSYLSFDRGGDAGTEAATEDAISQAVKGEGRKFMETLENVSGPIETKWGKGFKRYSQCLEYIESTNMAVPEGGVALPLPYTVDEFPSYSIVPSNQLWNDPSRKDDSKILRKEEYDAGRRRLYFPKVLRDARRIEEYHPGISPYTSLSMDKLGIALAHCDSECKNFYDPSEVEGVFYPEMEKLLLKFFPGASDALVFNHDIFDKDYEGDCTEDQEKKNPGVNTNCANLVHNDLNDNSGRVRCRELLTQNLRNFGRTQSYSVSEVEAKMSARFMSINLAKPMETVEQNPFVLCAWPSFSEQPYITNYRVYDDRVGETTRFTHRSEHDWYWLPQQGSTEISMLKCYDSVLDGSVSRWSFHTACIDPTALPEARCRKNIVVRSYVFF